MTEPHRGLVGDLPDPTVKGMTRRRRSIPWGGGRLKHYQDHGCPSCGSINIDSWERAGGGGKELIIHCVRCGDEFVAATGMPVKQGGT